MLFLPECPRQGLLLCNITTAVEVDNRTCCTVDGQTSVCVSYAGVSIGSTATYTTSDNFCIDNKVLTRSCTSDMMWEDMTPTAMNSTKVQNPRRNSYTQALGTLCILLPSDFQACAPQILA